MLGRRDVSKQRRILSWAMSVIIISSTLLIGISLQVPNAEAGSSVVHDVGNLVVNGLSDYGRLLADLTWGPTQTSKDQAMGVAFIGLVIDQDNYIHIPGSEDIADSFSNYPYFAEGDFNDVSMINMVIDNGVTEKSIASFQNTGVGTGDPNDILINQTAWTVKGKDWAIIQWSLSNIRTPQAALTNVCIGLELPLSQVGWGPGTLQFGLGGDSGDDIDGFDSVNNTYWAQDNNGTGTCIGFSSAIATDPITHYYSEDYHPANYDTYKVFWENDTWLYNRLHAPNSVEGSAVDGNRTAVVGWNGTTIPIGGSRTFTLVIAINDTHDNMIGALKDAQDYYENVATAFKVTEFSDDQSGVDPQRIEVYSDGRPNKDLVAEGYFLSLDGIIPLPGNWVPDPNIPTYGYRVFEVTGTPIGPEGDTFGLYQNLGGGNIVLVDGPFSYGQEGIIPDPLDGESVGRRFDTSTARYVDEWLRNASAGPTWNAQNDVGRIISPWVVINRVMFNPIVPAESYVELRYTGVSAFYDISNYRIVCNDAYIVPSGKSLNATNRFFVLPYSDFSQFFMNMDAPGDNVYLYDSNGNLLDMVGWSSSHNQGYFMSRMPDGNGTHQGYDDTTSQAAGWVFDQLPSLLITEFFANSTSAQIELYNPRGGEKVLNAAPPHWTLESSVSGGTLTGLWNLGTIPANGGYDYFTMNPGGGTPGDEGDTIGLYYTGTEIINEVSFGTFGVAPDPLVGESTARYWDNNILGYTNNWTRNASTGTTFGFQNDVPPINASSWVILNEVMFNPSVPGDGEYITIINIMPFSSVNIRNYYIVCDDIYRLPDFDIRIGYGGLVIINYSNAPALFDSMDPTGDNVYFYDSFGRLLDMVGWNTAHIQGMSARRVPDGNGTYQGHNDVTSEAAGWVFDSPLQVRVTEISDSGSSPSLIEVYNPWYPSINFSAFGFSFGSYYHLFLAGGWDIWTANSGEYAIFNVSGATPLNVEGDTISFYQNNILIEEIGYGTKGTVPDPLPGESVERYWNGAWYTNVWERNWTSGPNFGSQNDVPEANLTSPIILNEVLFYPNVAADHFVEVYNRGASPINISGYKIVCDKEYIIPNGTVLDFNERFFYLLYNMNQSFFDEPDGMTSTGDNVYLYNANGSLVDMVGWNSQHTIGGTVCRVPDGDGTRDGYDDVSSVAAGWRFDCTPTVQLIKVDIEVTMREPVLYGHFKTFVVFNMTITNFQSISDIVNIINYTEEGWPVEIFDETGTIKITSIAVGPGETINFKVKVILPDSIPFAVMDNITILVRSSNSNIIGDSIILTAKVYPFLNLTKTANPYQIYLNGTGHDEISTLTLNLTGMGAQVAVRRYLDCVFCIDSSGSMYYGPGGEPGLGNDPFGLRKIESQNFVAEHFEYPDRGAVVDFDEDAFLQPDPSGWPNGDHLSSDYAKIIANIELIDSGGGTIISTGLNLSNEELRWFGDFDDHVPIIILITDAINNDPLDNLLCLNEANIAASRGIIIVTIGLNIPEGSQSEQLLVDIANITGGMYFSAPDATYFKYIYENISKYLTDIAVWDDDIYDPIPLVQDVLPSYIDYVPGTFNIPPDKIEPAPGGGLILEWNMSWIKLGETVSITFDIVSKRPGVVETNVYDESRAFYTTWDNSTEIVYFPRCEVQVIPPAPLPPKLYIDVRPNKNDIRLYWDEPLSSATHHYLIYAAQNPLGFDFSTPWVDTSLLKDPFDPPASPPIGDRLSWNHTGAAVPSQEQWYYCIRTVNDLGEISRTSRTVGKWTKAFSQGVSTFSLPLEPLEVMNRSVDYYLNDMNARYIKWMDPFSHIWMKHGDGGDNDTQLEVGKGYEVCLDSSGKFTFLGMPGAMIRYNTGAFPGFNYNTNAKNLQVLSVNPVTGDVTLTWDPVLVGMDDDDDYYVYWATTRDGFDGTEGTDYILLDVVDYTDPIRVSVHSGATLSYPQLYYMVIPVNETGYEGASTYSIGVWTASYLGEYDTIGIPLIQTSYETADWWCNNIPNTVGINFYNVSAQRWSWHSKRMPIGAYDPMLIMTEGYQISTTGATKYIFIGR